MTGRELAKLIDRKATYSINGLQFEVMITDAMVGPYQRVDVVIEPVSGSGSKRVALTSVTVHES